MLKHARRATIALTTSALLATGLGGTSTAQAAGSGPTTQAKATADWLAGQVGKDKLVRSEYQDFQSGEWVTYTDHGLTLDFFYAFDGLGVRGKLRRAILNAIEPQTGAYVGSGDYAYAGATGKLLTAVQAMGRNPRTYSDQDQVARLEGLVHTEGDQKGRASDTWAADDPYGGDFSNTIGQSWVVRALTQADSSLAPTTVDFLLEQQCPQGFFRLYMESADFTCASGEGSESKPSVDATAFAVQALLVARREGVTGLGVEIRAAKRWLVRKQADNGSYSDAGIANANSTGVAAEALAQLGKAGAAARAASWLAKRQVSGKLSKKTAYRAVDVGAVAFSAPALRKGKQEGITRDVVYQWRRSTAQAAVGLNSTRQ